jgi:RNA polymerase sigma-70 factor (ECF subfamily)
MTASAAAVWAANRRRLLDIAYRMLGSRSEAEDVVQEAYFRLSQAALDDIDDLTGWLITVTGRLCIDQLRSSRVTRESYVGPWLPEPVLDTGSPSDPADRITLDDSVRMAMLIVLEQLTPPERAAFVLHDVFQIPFGRVADIVGRTPEACRQLASRARRRIAGAMLPRFDPDPELARAAAQEFAEACETGDFQRLVDILDPVVEGLFDSGGHIVGAPTDLVVGAEAVASILLSVFAGTAARFRVVLVNGDPGVAISLGPTIVSVAWVDVDAGRITRIHGIGNPEKLTRTSDGPGPPRWR